MKRASNFCPAIFHESSGWMQRLDRDLIPRARVKYNWAHVTFLAHTNQKILASFYPGVLEADLGTNH
jgi:hypothetical protein